MKRILLYAAASLLLVPSLAMAQRDNDRRPGVNRPGGPSTLPARPPGPGPGIRPPGPGMRPPPRPPIVRPPSRPQFSWRGRYLNRYRAPAFRYPSGYAYRRWTVGAVLPLLFLSSNYFFDDWRTLGVDRPPPGHRWVRYGPDLVLVNTRTHRIVDVVNDAFY